MLQRSLTGIRDSIKRRLGNDVVSIEISDITIEELIKEALSFVSQYRPRLYGFTIGVGERYGKVTVTRVVYPESWKVGDAVPTPEDDDRVLGISSMEPGESSSPSMTRVSVNPGDPFFGNSMFMNTNIQYYISNTMDMFINYEILNYSMWAMNSLTGNLFDWYQDVNHKNIGYFTNLDSKIGKVTVEAMLEWDLDNYWVPPPTGSTTGTKAVKVIPKLDSTVYALTEKLARSRCMQAIGRIRSKLLGGSNSTELDGSGLLSEGNDLEKEAIDEIKKAATYMAALDS